MFARSFSFRCSLSPDDAAHRLQALPDPRSPIPMSHRVQIDPSPDGYRFRVTRAFHNRGDSSVYTVVAVANGTIGTDGVVRGRARVSVLFMTVAIVLTAAMVYWVLRVMLGIGTFNASLFQIAALMGLVALMWVLPYRSVVRLPSDIQRYLG